jgi:signal transduction histidine kinase
MDLKHKLRLIAVAYAASLIGTLVTSAWCIVVYFGSVLSESQQNLAFEEGVVQLRGHVRRQRDLVQDSPLGPRAAEEYQGMQEEIAFALEWIREQGESLAGQEIWPQLDAAMAAKDAVARARLLPRGDTQEVLPLTAEDLAAFVKLDRLLGGLVTSAGLARARSVQDTERTQRRILSILAGNAALGVFLCLLGLYSAGRWMIRPVEDLREATRQFSAGNFGHHIDIRSKDELGRLAAEVNAMGATIVDMQRRLVEQERLAAAAEMVRLLAHNIRNPLGGIRGLAEALAQRHVADKESAECLQRIIATVDRFERWLRDVQQSVSPLELKLRPVDVGEPISNVVTALRPMLDRREVRIHVEIQPELREIELDALHFEQALVALVTNAVQVSEPGQQVAIRARLAPGEPGRWQLIVEDQGPGVPPELRDKVFLPFFSTKRDGSGLGLPMARKVVMLHGGELRIESNPGGGSRFMAVLPGTRADR